MPVLRRPHNHPQPAVVQFRYGRLHGAVVPAHPFVKPALFVQGSVHFRRNLPCPSVVVRIIDKSPAAVGTVRARYYPFAAPYKKRRFIHYAEGIVYFHYRPAPFQTPFRAQGIYPRTRAEKPDEFPADGRLYVGIRKFVRKSYAFPIQSSVATRQVNRMFRFGVRTVVVVSHFAVRHKRKPYKSIARRSPDNYGSIYIFRRTGILSVRRKRQPRQQNSNQAGMFHIHISDNL